MFESYRGAAPARRALFIAVLAVLAALLSNYAYDAFGDLAILGVPPLPAIYFGILLAIGCTLWTSAGKLGALAILAVTFLAWFAAFETAAQVHRWMSDIPGISSYRLFIAGLAGGFVGSSITAIGVSLAAREFPNTKAWSRTVMIGTVAGILLECLSNENRDQIPFHVDSLLPLFLIWQPAVAASIAYGLPRRPRDA
jgi:vacuolar-type H+-ATPase subunit I/STV1